MILRMIIAGGRDFDDYDRLKNICSSIIKAIEEGYGKPFDSIEIISGRARGADTLGEQFAITNQYVLKLFPADWDGLGKFAGYARNEQMAKYAACVDTPELRGDVIAVLVAFWDGRSRGTKNMIGFAHMYEFNDTIIEYYPVAEDKKI